MKREKSQEIENDQSIRLIKVLLHATNIEVGMLRKLLEECRREKLHQFRREIEEGIRKTAKDKSPS